MAAPHLSISEAKAQLRRSARALREACDPSLGAELGNHLLASVPIPPGAVVAGTWPIGREIDLRPLLALLHGRGHPVVLPVTPTSGRALSFRLWHPGMAMEPERFGTWRPTGPERTPDLLLVPLLAFDRRCHRLGYGGGFYDRTLAGLPDAVAVGCAYAAQEVAEVPTGPFDVPLAAVATERGVHWAPKG